MPSALRDRKIILYELNEVPFRVLDSFCREHPDSVIARRLPQLRQYETFADDNVLSPWVTWPTVHRGVCDQAHGIRHFGQSLTAADSQFPPIWQILQAHGVSTGVFASLHTYPTPSNLRDYAFYVSDPFAMEPTSHPEELSVFQDFNLKMSRASPRNVSTRVPLEWATRLLLNWRALGIRRKTTVAITRQLAEEQIWKWKRVRRRTFQTVLAFDVFMRQLESKRPQFSTFFTNHVASSMHRYWAAAFPADFATNEFDDAWRDRYRNEIAFAMRQFDSQFERLLAFVDSNPEYTLWIVSSMGQAAAGNAPVRSQVHLTDVASFMATLGVPSSAWTQRPAMAPDVSISVQGPTLEAFRKKVASIRVSGNPIFVDEREPGFFGLSFGQSNLAPSAEFVEVAGETMPFEKLGLENVRIEDESGSSGYHVPRGTMLVYDPRCRDGQATRQQVKTTAIAPTLLSNFAVPIPSYMPAPLDLS